MGTHPGRFDLSECRSGPSAARARALPARPCAAACSWDACRRRGWAPAPARSAAGAPRRCSAPATGAARCPATVAATAGSGSAPCLLLGRSVCFEILLARFPVVHLLLGFVLADAVGLLDAAEQLVALAGDAVEVVVGQLAPLLLHFALRHLPVAFDAIPIH